MKTLPTALHRFGVPLGPLTPETTAALKSVCALEGFDLVGASLDMCTGSTSSAITRICPAPDEAVPTVRCVICSVVAAVALANWMSAAFNIGLVSVHAVAAVIATRR